MMVDLTAAVCLSRDGQQPRRQRLNHLLVLVHVGEVCVGPNSIEVQEPCTRNESLSALSLALYCSITHQEYNTSRSLILVFTLAKTLMDK
ncbi:hypothetical protein E2C01_014750 [Portunus trituberculatus]|uniref:Uncharacterized protein n=1 Tax=Portunus trituberculatus TaxID=210409 RepID=A0A5B7DKS3_PORTR|nr:hypothetical protein [Portunus trituberculatus]